MKGLIGKKIGMTSVFDGGGNYVGCTVLEVGPCVVTQVKNEQTDGYYALQLGYGERKEKNTTNPLLGHFNNANTTPKRKVREFRNFEINKALGDTLTVSEIFNAGEKVHITGISKGKGFQGVVKRHGFSGVGEATHGQHNRLRHPGSIGAASFPARVFKGMRMAGRTGGDRITVRNLVVVQIFPDKNLLLVKGALPGHNGAFVSIWK